MVGLSAFTARTLGSIPGGGTTILQAVRSQLKIMCRKRHFVCLRNRSLEPY